MDIIEFNDDDYIKEAFKKCNWGAADFLLSLIEESKRDILGWNHIYMH